MNFSILLTVKRPDEQNHQSIGEYDGFVRTLASLAKQNKDIRLFAESTILLPLNKGLQEVADVVNALKHLPYTYAIQTEDQSWYEAINKF